MLAGAAAKVKQFAENEIDWKVRLQRLQAASHGCVHELLEWEAVVHWLEQAAEYPTTKWYTENGREVRGAEEIVNRGLEYLGKRGFKLINNVCIPPDAQGSIQTADS